MGGAGMKAQLSLLILSIQSKLLTLISICFAFFLPISGILIMIGVLIAIDTFTGIKKAHKLKEKITSRKLSSIISKLALYEITVIMFFLIDRFILNEIILQFFSVAFMLTKVVALVLASVELISINENIKEISAKNLDLWQSAKALFARAKDIKEDLNKLK
jgi:hypothetical protein